MNLRRNVMRVVHAGILASVWSGCGMLGTSDLSETGETELTSATPAVRLHGTNLVGMEGLYDFDASAGPIPDVDYAVHSTSVIDYLASRNVNVIRFLFSWERMQSALDGDIPAASSGNYRAYFDDYMRIVDYATREKSMTVIVTPWQTTLEGGAAGGARWRGHVVGGEVVSNAHFAHFWSKMAGAFRDHPRVAIGLITEPNKVDTMRWFATAQDAISAIRKTGFDGEIYVPGNGWTAASSWEDTWYDTGMPQRSNAYGWLNARGEGQPLADPLDKLIVEVHTYADGDAAGSTEKVLSNTISRERVSGVVDWARAHRLKVFVGEIGMHASAPNAAANWTDFVHFMNDNTDTVVGYSWWACGKPGWWDDVGAMNGGHFSITPTNEYKLDTVNMKLLFGGAVRPPETVTDGDRAPTEDGGVDPDAAPPGDADAGADAGADRGTVRVTPEPSVDERKRPTSAKQSHAAPEEPSSPEPEPVATGGCSTTGAARADAGIAFLGTAIALAVTSTRRRRTRPS